jgi:hypothetical protein
MVSNAYFNTFDISDLFFNVTLLDYTLQIKVY